MTHERRWKRRWAVRLTTHAAKVMPDSRSEWGIALANELDAVSGDDPALRWAFGAISTSYMERIKIMKLGNLRLPRWLLGSEMLICFLPLTLLAVIGFSVEVAGDMNAIRALTYLSVGAIGPFGLYVAFQAVVLQRVRLGRTIRSLLFFSSGWTLLVFFGAMIIWGGAPYSEWWRESFLIALLPAIGTAHLALLGRQAPTRRQRIA